MKRGILFMYVIALIGLLAGCQEDNDNYIPTFDIITKQTNGLTTDIFEIEVSPTTSVPSDQKLYCRWDWEGDSIFNTIFSNELVINHRFLKPGQYNIICEVLTLGGIKATNSLGIDIQQGYSEPKALFRVVPETGHFRTSFVFDAGETYDYEDSLKRLKFRWDFQSDGQWDTPFLDSPTVIHQFEKMQDYSVKLNVIDPSQRSGSFTKVVELHRTDTCIVPKFNWTTDVARVGSQFIFDASNSYHSLNPDIELRYKWLFPEQEYTEGSKNPTIEHVFITPGKKKVELVVEDEFGLQNTIEKEFFVAIENLPPKPKILTQTLYGNVTTQFYLNLWESRDDRTAPSKLKYRWDYDGDGNWDTEKNSEMETYHQYQVAGNFKCILEAEDEEGLTDTTSLVFHVSPHEYPTSYFIDSRDNKLYETVKIGDHWWMSENLDFRIEAKIGSQHVQMCYEQDPANCDKYGALYAIDYAFSYEEAYGHSICPDSWHIPSKEEMDNLINRIGITNGRDKLVPMGGSGFNALYSGYIYYDVATTEEGEQKFSYLSKDLGITSYFITTLFIQKETFPYVYSLHITKNQSDIFPHNASLKGFYSVRCVKN